MFEISKQKSTAKARCKFKGNKVSKQIKAFETIIETNYIDQTTGGKLLYVLFVTTLYLITQFIGNINNFNVTYFLTAGNAATIGILVFIICSLVSLITFRRSASYQNEEAFQ